MVKRLFIPGRIIEGFLEKAVFVIPDIGKITMYVKVTTDDGRGWDG